MRTRDKDRMQERLQEKGGLAGPDRPATNTTFNQTLMVC